MKLAFQSLVATTMLLASGCLILGGGIAGAGADPFWRVAAAKNYDEYISDRIEIEIVPNATAEPPTWHFEDVMRNFPASVDVVGAEYEAIAGTAFQARYNASNRKFFELRNSDATVIYERLPKVFYMRGPQLGIGKVADTEVVMILNRSRATTGLYFIGLFTVQGEPLYKATLKPYEARDVRVTANTIEILGECETRKISFLNQ